MSSEFVHLHNHSEYSMLDGACRISDMIQWAVENSAPAVALTDHGNMFGAWEFYTKAQEAGVNPIVGCEVYVAPGDRKKRGKEQGSPYHLTLLVENATGYQNLLELVSLGYTEGFYSKPRIDMEILREYREGIIALTGCIQGQVPQLVASDKREEGIQNFKTLIDIMGPRNLYVEVQNHYIDKELEAYPIMVDLAREFDLPLVGTNDCHYLHKSDHHMHDVLLCIQTKKTVNEQDRMRFDNHFYFKDVNEMREVLKNYPPEAISNTLEIAKRCNLKLDYGKSVMPKYDVPEGHTNESYLKELCYQGLREKLGGELSSDVLQRLNHELDIINKTGYPGYFLIVWDYVKYANEQGYPLTARGSAAGSLVLYALDVITFNPMEYGCIFERFLNLERISPPDIDIDFADRARDHVIEYLVKKYGQDSVGKVATFATMGAKAAIKDVGRTLDVPLENVNKLTQLIPSIPGITLDDALEQVPEFQALAEQPENKELMDLSKSVEGMKRHVSCHASAIVVSNGPLTDFAPLFKDKNDQVATQFEGKTVENVGIVKFDFLGVRSLTEIHDCLQMVKANHGIDLKLEDIPFDDEKTFSLISRGLIAALFQLETSSGMYRVVTQLKADNFEDFAAIPALYRPGPLESGMMQQFIDRKNGLEPVSYLHPSLEDALKNTYGVCVYQEQVMQIARDMAGFTLGEADILRDAMGKKKLDLIKSQREKFVEGALKNEISKKDAEEIYDLLEPFSGYAFNKSHSVAYAMLAYRMAYLKTHYPHEFMAAMMTGEAGDSSKITRYRAECVKLADFLGVEINVLPPDVNSSNKDFAVDGNDICFGLVAVKNVGDNAIDAIVDARKEGGSFTSLQDFCERVDTKVVNKRSVEGLILSGAFDNLEGHRAQLLENLESILKAAQSAQAVRERGQMNLFGEAEDMPTTVVTLAAVEEYDPLERLKLEKEQLGFYVSGHPLQQYTDIIENYTSASTQNLGGHPIESTVSVAGMITSVTNRTTKKGDSMAILEFEDLEGSIEVVVFPEAYKKAGDLFEDRMVWIEGTVRIDQNRKTRNSDDEDEVEERQRQIQADTILDIETVAAQQTSAVEVTIAKSDLDNLEKLKSLKEIALANKGELHLILRLMSPRFGEVITRCGSNYKITDKEDVFKQVENLFGQNCIKRSNRTKPKNGNRSTRNSYV
ncbi:MAG: DNA polymerase III subunit alpha [Candidatus Poribacteria bacterium]|nr:DNA polymerase III subunit alpha [Candidatus Poribacteria bacterium]